MESSPPQYDAALAFLLGRIDYERMLNVPYGRSDFKLDRMRDLARRLGDPQDRMLIVHIAGTKGKGSTAAMTAAILTQAGYRTGLFTSPHLERLEERISVDGRECPPAELARLIERIRPVVEEMDAAAERDNQGATYFEILTAAGLLYFVDQRVDWAVLEVGLGGRLDSTNICQPVVAAITSISYDHTKQLGSTLREIAGEKAAIIKPGVRVVSGVIADEPRRVVAAVAAEQGCRLAQLGEQFDYRYYPAEHLERSDAKPALDFHFRDAGSRQSYRGLELKLIGEHQAANAAVALATIVELGEAGCEVPEAAIRAGLAAVRSPARVEVLARHPAVVLDAAHNVASVEAFVETLRGSFQTDRRILIFATTRDKDARGMLRVLLPYFDRVILTRYQSNPRGTPAEELAALAAELSGACDPAEGRRAGSNWQLAADPAAAWEAARRMATTDSLIGITGSFFAAAEIRAIIEGRALPAPAMERR
jgi:dihydrofolate synthase / folylpolyglutamate synthase